MEKRTIVLDGVEYFLIPKTNIKLPEGIEIKFEKTEVKTYFDIQVKGWYTRDAKPFWCLFRRIENGDGSFEWIDYSTGGVRPIREHELIVESWYQNYKLMKEEQKLNDTSRTFKCNRCSTVFTLIDGDNVGCCAMPVEHRTSGICGGELIEVNIQLLK